MAEIINENIDNIVDRIMNIAESRVGWGRVDYGDWAREALERIAPMMPVRPSMEFFLYGDRTNFTDPEGRELLRDGKLLDTRLLQEYKHGGDSSEYSICIGRVIYPVTRAEGRSGIEKARIEHRRAVIEAQRALIGRR